MQPIPVDDPQLRRSFILQAHRRLTRNVWKVYLSRTLLLKCHFESDQAGQEKSYCAQLTDDEAFRRASLSSSESEILYQEIYGAYDEPGLLPYYWNTSLKPAWKPEPKPRTLMERVVSSFASQVSKLIAYPCHQNELMPLHNCWVPPASRAAPNEKTV